MKTKLILRKFISSFMIGLIGSGLYLNFASAEVLDSIIAVVDDDVIMESELDRRIERAEKDSERQGKQLPPHKKLKKQILESLIMINIQLQAAERIGIKVDENMLNQAIGNIAAENKISLEEFRKTLESEGFNYNQFREDIREEITLSRLKQRQVTNKIFVSEREIKNYLATQKQQGNDTEELHIQHILIPIPDDADKKQIKATKKQAEEVLEKLNSGVEFSSLATEFSAASDAHEGGDMGWIEASKVPSLFSLPLSHMKKGQHSDLLESDSGFHIIRLADKRSTDIQMIPQTHARHILIRTNEVTTDEDAKSRLLQLIERIEDGTDFADLARSNSDDSVSAANGGDLGWSSPGNMVPKFEEQMALLSDGEISAPFQTQYGWHIVQVLERREYDGTHELTMAKARAAVQKRKVEEARQAWLIRLRDEAYVEYR